MKELFRRLLPDSILGRTVLALVVGLLLSHGVALTLYSGNRLETLIGLAGREASERIAVAAEAARDATTHDEMRAARRLAGSGLRMAWMDRPLVAVDGVSPMARALRERLTRRLGANVEVRVAVTGGDASPDSFPQPMPGWGKRLFGRRMHEAMHGAPGRAVAIVSLRFSDPRPGAAWLNFAMPLEEGESLWRPGFGAPLLLLTLVTLGFSVWAVRRAARPLGDFAAAARRLGADAAAGAPP
ncbi:MAG: hypothetical protein FJX42_06950, partial [Alphaproteobacteria bacterium]|nr:hypothetical protein [Alphaproteobacteria bacterium]